MQTFVLVQLRDGGDDGMSELNSCKKNFMPESIGECDLDISHSASEVFTPDFTVRTWKILHKAGTTIRSMLKIAVWADRSRRGG